MAFNFVNSISGTSGSASVVLTLSVTAGNTIIAGGGSTSLPNTITISDGVNTYTECEAAFPDSGSNTVQRTFTAKALTTTTLTITISFTNSANWQAGWALQFSNGATSPVDKTADATNTSTTAVVTGTTATTSQAGEALIGIFVVNTGSVIGSNFSSAGSGYTLQETGHAGSGGAIGYGVVYQIVSATGTYQASATAGTSGSGGGVIITLKDSGSSGPTVDQLSSAFDNNLFDFSYAFSLGRNQDVYLMDDKFVPILPAGVTDEVLYPIDLDYPNVQSPYVHEQQIDEEVGTSQFIILPQFKSWDEDTRLQFNTPSNYGLASDSGQDNTQFIIVPKAVWDNDGDNQRGQLGGYAIESPYTDDWTQLVIIPAFDPSLSLVDDFIPQNSQLFVVKDDSTDDFKFLVIPVLEEDGTFITRLPRRDELVNDLFTLPIIPAFDPSQSLVDDYIPQQKTDNVTTPQDDIFDEISFTPPITPPFDPSQSLSDGSEFFNTRPIVVNVARDINVDESFIDAVRRYIDRQRRRRE